MEPRRDGERASTTSLPGFVSTTMLTSADGLFGDNVAEERITETPAPHVQDADYKPLYDRLQEMKDQKDREWKEKNNPFAPPKALDDEEIQFIRDLESQQSDAANQRKAQQQEDLVGFLLARESTKSSVGESGPNKTAPVRTAVSDAALKQYGKPEIKSTPSIALKAKRKATSITPVVVKKKKKTRTSAESMPDTGTKKKEENSVKAKATPVAKPAMNLVGYGSDSDSDSGSGNR